MSLQSYEAIYDHGQMKWLGDKPQVEEARVIVTILPEKKRETEVSRATLAQRRSPSLRLRGAIKMADDLIAPIAPAEEWEALK